jgi:alkylation response protein AidB-like acyl-CoA dehydrogenase
MTDAVRPEMSVTDVWRQAAAHHASGAELVLTSALLSGGLPAETARTSRSFTIFEGTSEIQRMIIGRAVTGLDVR